MTSSTYTLKIELPRVVSWKGSHGVRSFSRDDFFAHLWEEVAGVVGVHEGTLLSEDAFQSGLETESWTVDSGEAPRERDWIENQEVASAVIYFGTREDAIRARAIFAENAIPAGEVLEQLPQDWDAEWKASFQGAFVPPCWEIRPPWVDASKIPVDHVLLRLNPGAGFGTGTHETTQLCLGAITEAFHRARGNGEFIREVLDFGSGSEILSIGCALLGARVDGIEIDELAIDNAMENAGLNGVEKLVYYAKSLSEIETKRYLLVIANILRPVLLEFAGELCSRVAPGGSLILSGLIESDCEEVARVYASRFGRAPEKRERNEWRALVFTNRPG